MTLYWWQLLTFVVVVDCNRGNWNSQLDCRAQAATAAADLGQSPFKRSVLKVSSCKPIKLQVSLCHEGRREENPKVKDGDMFPFMAWLNLQDYLYLLVCTFVPNKYIQSTQFLIKKMNGSISLLPFCHSQTLVDVSALTRSSLIGDHFQRIVYSRYFREEEVSLHYENHLHKKQICNTYDWDEISWLALSRYICF